VLIDSTHRGWIRFTLFLFIVATALYVPYHLWWSATGPRGSSLPGLVYGGVGTALMFFAGALGVRRKMRAVNLGRATTWLRGHIWLGLLAYPLILFHAGFRVGGALTIVLLVLFTVVTVTGIFGIIVQQIVPKLMTVEVSVETMYEQVATYVARLAEESARMVTDVCGPLGKEEDAAAAALAAPSKHGGGKGAKKVEPLEGSGPLKQFYENEIGSYLADGRGRLASVASRTAVFSQVKMLLPPTLHTTLSSLEELCEERRQLALQIRLHHWMHGWLIVHLPAAAALLVLTVVHAVASVYY
jgi:hypothetical protein